MKTTAQRLKITANDWHQRIYWYFGADVWLLVWKA